MRDKSVWVKAINFIHYTRNKYNKCIISFHFFREWFGGRSLGGKWCTWRHIKEGRGQSESGVQHQGWIRAWSWGVCKRCHAGFYCRWVFCRCTNTLSVKRTVIPNALLWNFIIDLHPKTFWRRSWFYDSFKIKKTWRNMIDGVILEI